MHSVEAKVSGPISLKNRDIEFVVRQDRKKVGTLFVSKGNIEWLPARKSARRRLRWARFDSLMQDHGKEV